MNPKNGFDPVQQRDGVPGRIWIAWEMHRRSLNLAKKVKARLFVFRDEDKGFLRYPLSIAKTLALLARAGGRVVFVQNPSMILAALACLCKRYLGYYLVIDRHSNFTFGLHDVGFDFRRSAASVLSRYTLRRADMTIVTNPQLGLRVRAEGGRPFILPDPFPDLPKATKENIGHPMELLFVSSWAPDEPIAEMLDVCRLLQDEIKVYITGKMKPKYAELMATRPPNLIPTGFLSDQEYFALMGRMDGVIAITKRPATLVCGAYEAIAMGKPLVLGDSQALREYFNQGAVYTDSTVPDLAAKIKLLMHDLRAYREEIAQLHRIRSLEWDEDLKRLNAAVCNRGQNSRSP